MEESLRLACQPAFGPCPLRSIASNTYHHIPYLLLKVSITACICQPRELAVGRPFTESMWFSLNNLMIRQKQQGTQTQCPNQGQRQPFPWIRKSMRGVLLYDLPLIKMIAPCQWTWQSE